MARKKQVNQVSIDDINLNEYAKHIPASGKANMDAIDLGELAWLGDDGKWDSDDHPDIKLEIRAPDESIELAICFGKTKALKWSERHKEFVKVLSKI